ncbi:hypothetical protein HY357_02510 [Candidatus Roizmanbacteria bacterium]|nr:hypothetical protein [Candidatus Roizmanbacteria bacterium]
MKIKLDYALKKILKQNIPFVITLTVLIILGIVGTVIFVVQYQESISKTAALETEIAKLNKKKELVDFKNQVIQGEFDLDLINTLLTQLVPNQEDFFSIIVAFEKLSAQTNFVITAYTINLANSEGKLSITIEGTGDPDSFLSFLKEYNLGGGRLITIDKLEFAQESFTGSKISINVYSGKATGAEVLTALTEEDRKLIAKVLDKVQVEIKSEEIVEYPTKQNPF